MRMLMLRLKGYSGINSGLLRDEITIDFSKSKHNICLIKGATGSGKSTILNAISPLPDDNSTLAPGHHAEKEIVYNNGIRILIIHPINNRGERATTKAYFFENEINLNPNGNVSSYKDIVFDKLDLDNNFEALSKLSNTDRGLADKTPAVRKRYVSNIISSVEVFNNMNKTLTKHSATLKSMLSSIVAKIDSLGDEKNIDANIANLEKMIEGYEKEKERISFENASAVTLINTLDPDGSIMMKITETEKKLAELELSRSNINSLLNTQEITPGITTSAKLKSEISLVAQKISGLVENIKSHESKLNDLLNRSEIENQELAEKLAKLNTLTQDGNYDILMNNIKDTKHLLAKTCQFFDSIHIEDALSLTSAEYRIGMDTLRQLREMLFSLYNEYDQYIIQRACLMMSNDNGNEYEELSKHEKEVSDRISELGTEMAVCTGQLEVYRGLSKRPKDCTIDSCEFIRSALEIGYNPEEMLGSLIEQMDQARQELESITTQKNVCSTTMNCLSKIRHIIDKINTSRPILEKLPGLQDFLNIDALIANMAESSSVMALLPDERQIIDAMAKADMFDSYKLLIAQYEKLQNQKQLFDSKHDVIDEIQSGIDKIRKRLDDIADTIESERSEIYKANAKRHEYEDLGTRMSTICQRLEEKELIESRIVEVKLLLQEWSKNADKLKEAHATVYAAKSALEEINNSMKPTREDLNRYKYNKQRLGEYREEMQLYKDRFDKTETVKYYTSPTKDGIQLLFMEMYMHNILSMANDLLAKIFNGQFMLQPFVINGDEFRIPCVGNRIMNDDISSMSNGQISMISMILSFSILYNSSSTYNILKLDEIDGGLDADNRGKFILILNEIMQILGCEQCFLISHNEEIQYSSTDMILLRTNSTNADYGDANILFDIRSA